MSAIGDKFRVLLAVGALTAFTTSAWAMDHHEGDAAATCKEMTIEGAASDHEFLRDKPVAVPGEYRNIATSTNTVMTIRTLAGNAMCEEVAYTLAFKDFWASGDGRFFGFHSNEIEADGHYVFDRAGNGTKLNTGARPVFSDDATMFAAVQQSGAGWGNLEGLSVWEIGADGTKAIFEMTEKLPKGSEWKVLKWEGKDNIILSVKSEAAVNAAISNAVGDYRYVVEALIPDIYRLSKEGSTWKLENITPAKG